ncbi:MAG: type II toxin-antitoxin system HicB family antitoxin [Dehalococcoidia bacterium]|nr:type II toxin-antitoxin system HicB family antitoxin [Dehalococcoidia bacterium]MSQ17705.1 type II toxin-antitoxin system HicB family antitoxin [Dehalococcoidia bacterium]
MATLQYSVVLVSNDPELGYTATVPALPGCVSFGDSLEEALENVKDAISLYIRDCRQHGEAVPDDRGAVVMVSVEVAA